ncbi:MAG: peptidylprolyl isomerase [Clostridium sp.]|uniref:peptidylprolyl isomerase n=1 Tax=Clostridium sp. TaxID=1506 RepID=UPI003F3F887B
MREKNVGKIKKIIALGLVAVASMSFVGCKMIQKTPEAINNEALAKIGDQKITRGDLNKVMDPYYKQLEQQYGANYKDNAQIKTQLLQQEKQQLNALVDRKVMLDEAQKNGWAPKEEDLNKQIDEQMKVMKSAYKTEDEFKQAYEENGYKDENALKDMIKDNIIVKLVIDDHILKDAKVSDEDVKKYYDDNKAQFTNGAGADAYNIVLPDEATAKKVREEIVSGKVTFKAMAEKYNTDNTKTTGGSLGFVPYDSTQLLPEFMTAFKKLKAGEVSQPVKTQYGYHLIKAEDIKTKESVTPFDKVKDQIKKQLENTKEQKVYEDTLKKWKDELGVKVYEDKLQ